MSSRLSRVGVVGDRGRPSCVGGTATFCADMPGSVLSRFTDIIPGSAGTSSGSTPGRKAFNCQQCCYERREDIIDEFFDLVAATITVRRLIRQA